MWKETEGERRWTRRRYTHTAHLCRPFHRGGKYLNIGRLFHQQVIADDGDQLAEKRQSSCDMNVCVGIVQVIASSVYTLARKDNRRSSVGHRALYCKDAPVLACISLQASRAKFKQVHPSSIYHRRPAHHLIPGPINTNQTAYSSIRPETKDHITTYHPDPPPLAPHSPKDKTADLRERPCQ